MGVPNGEAVGLFRRVLQTTHLAERLLDEEGDIDEVRDG